MSAGYLRQGHEVVEREWQYIKSKRGYPEEKRWELAGLAISGGGIRSAAFGLGVLQGLVRIDRLEDIDYLSSVSGGGYIGASLTWFLHRPRGETSYGVRARDFPLGQRMRGARPAQDEARPQDNAILNFIRQRANYLSPGGGLNLVSMVAVVLRSLLLGLIVHFPLLALLVYGLGRDLHSSRRDERSLRPFAAGRPGVVPSVLAGARARDPVRPGKRLLLGLDLSSL